MPEAMLVILRSDDDGETWKPVPTADVPEWLKAPDVVAKLVAGEMAKFAGGIVIPDEMRPWYRAEKVSSEGETKQ
jgi:hypothetical protein